MPNKQIMGLARLLKLFGAASLALLLSSLSWAGLLSLLLMCVTGLLIYRRVAEVVRERGLCSFLPEQARLMLMERRVFDLLCDFWYMPQELSNNGKRLLTPVLEEMEPEKAREFYETSGEATRKAMFSKGLINFLPASMRKLALPALNEDNKENNHNVFIGDWDNISYYDRKPSKSGILRFLKQNAKTLRGFSRLKAGQIVSGKVLLKIMAIGFAIMALQFLRRPRQKFMNTIHTATLVVGFLLMVGSSGLLIWRVQSNDPTQSNKPTRESGF